MITKKRGKTISSKTASGPSKMLGKQEHLRVIDDESSMNGKPNPFPKPFTDHFVADMMRLGLTGADLDPSVDITEIDNPGLLTKVESAHILSKKFMTREKVKNDMILSHEKQIRRLARNRINKVEEWTYKTSKSPFTVNLLAENERIAEENLVRLRDEERRKKMADKRKHSAKSKIILKALSEVSDLDSLRREKRAILEEEKRLKALLDLEKMKLHTKEDVLLAQRAERQRKDKRKEFRRSIIRDINEQEVVAKHEILKEFLSAPPKPDNTFTSFGN